MIMKRNFASLLIAVFTASVILVSCSSAPDSKAEYLKDYSSFMEDIKKNKDSLTEAEWKEKDKQFEKFSSELYGQYENDLGIVEQVKIGKHGLQYAKMRGLSALKNVSESGELQDAIKEIKDVVNSGEIQDAIKEFESVWNDDLKGEFKTALSELEGIWDDDLKNQLSSSLDEVKTALEESDIEVEIDGKVKELEEILEDEDIKQSIKEIIGELKNVLEKAEVELEK